MLDNAIHDYYTPDSWVMLKITHSEGFIYKILAGWRGGYLDGDHWKLNSGVVRVEETDNHYLFHGSSGSVYRCNKDRYQLSGLTSGIFNNFQRKVNAATGTTVELVDKDSNFMEIVYE
jgi:hypothetical protein